jgi:hypothetical protein
VIYPGFIKVCFFKFINLWPLRRVLANELIDVAVSAGEIDAEAAGADGYRDEIVGAVHLEIG